MALAEGYAVGSATRGFHLTQIQATQRTLCKFMEVALRGANMVCYF